MGDMGRGGGLYALRLETAVRFIASGTKLQEEKYVHWDVGFIIGYTYTDMGLSLALHTTTQTMYLKASP
jgi:hypothetical protein